MSEQERPLGETDNCRSRLLKYCRGQGLDIGCGTTKISADSIGIDLYSPYADMNQDGRILSFYPDGSFDYVYSSHLLEEIADTKAVLKEWLRVIKSNGYLVLYQADKDYYYPLGSPECNKRHLHHFDWQRLWVIFQDIGGVELIHHARYGQEHNEWSFELVVKKSTGIGFVHYTDKPEIVPITIEPIVILIPTKNRPHSIETFCKTIDKVTANPDNVTVVFGIHEEDKPSLDKVEVLRGQLKIHIRSEILSHYEDGKFHLSYLWNQLYAKTTEPIIGFFGDDVLFKTPGWDVEVVKEFSKSKSIMISCNDIHVQKGKSATLFFTHRSFHEKIGYYLCMRFRRWYQDTFLDLIYQNAGKLIYREDIVTEHIHPSIFPDKKDAVYIAMEGYKEEDKKYWLDEKNQAELLRCIEILKSIQ